MIFIARLCVCAQSLSRVQLFAIAWTAALQAPQSMEFSRQEYWSGFPFRPPGNLPDPRIKSRPPASPTLPGEFFTTSHLGSSIT